jgi:peptide/nickel transport system substrate-binding protein
VSTRRRRLMATGAALAVSLVAAACGSSASRPSSGAARTTQPAGTPVHGGTVAWAELPATTPDFIFPMPPLAEFSNANLFQFDNLLFRPLYWFGDAGKPVVDLARSLAAAPVFSDGDTRVAITLRGYRWTDGQRVDARDVIFWMDLLKAEKNNWGAYVPGYFPDNVKTMTMPDGPTGDEVDFGLTGRANPTWFLYNELSQVTPLPIAWDKTSAAAPAPAPGDPGLPDTTPAGARAVYSFLVGQGKDLTTYTTNPLWKIVDGPWELSAFTSGGEATFVPNPHYAGADHPYLAKFVEVPFTTDTAEFDTVKSGTSALQVGYVPAQDLPKLASVASEGYRDFASYLYGFNYLQLNFTNPAAGPLFDQAYLRQALQRLMDQPGWVKAYYAGLAAPTYGPVPVVPPNGFADAFERSDPYPYDPSVAKTLLRAHGWDVRPGATTICVDPARCGAGIHKGEALDFTLDYASGSLPVSASMQDFASEAATVGVHLDLVSQSFNTVLGEAVATNKSWQIANYGLGWSYGPDYYASGEELFASGAGENSGAYTSAEANKLIAATTSVGEPGSQSALDRYQDYLATQLPVLYQPVAGTEQAVVGDLGGTVLTPNPFDSLDPESWYYVKH